MKTSMRLFLNRHSPQDDGVRGWYLFVCPVPMRTVRGRAHRNSLVARILQAFEKPGADEQRAILKQVRTLAGE